MWDVDGNRFVDLTSAFAVANVGHGHPRVVAAVQDQADRLLHGMGDVHPPAVKVELLEELARRYPGGVAARGVLSSSGSDAVEGRHFLPDGVDRADVFALARSDLDAATEYVTALQRASAARGLVAFTALPVLLARATLDIVETSGAGTKISRLQVMQIVQDMNEALDAGRSVF